MVEFAKSPHEVAQTRYEQQCREVHASNSDARRDWRQQIEDSLVEGGQTAIDEYKALMDKLWQAARCLAEYDGVNMGYAIVFRAQARLDAVGVEG
jgi:hypothetical protein